MFFIILDSYSKWVEFYPMKTITSNETIEKLRDCLSRFGLPITIMSDNGTQFTSADFQTFCSKNGIIHKTSAPYNPQSNGAAENAVKSFKNGMQKALTDPQRKKESVETLMSRYLFYYRSSVHTTTLETPYKLMFNREMRTQFDRIKPSALAEMCDQKQTDDMENNKQSNKSRVFSVNDRVLVRDYRHPKQPWKMATIKSTIGNKMYLCSTADGEWRRHANQILSHTNAKTVNSTSNFDNDYFSYSDRFSISNQTQTPIVNDVEPTTTTCNTQATAAGEIIPNGSEIENVFSSDPNPPANTSTAIATTTSQNENTEIASTEIVTRFGRTSKKPARFGIEID